MSPDIAASVRARLLNGAQARHEDFNLTLQRFVGERFLYRLGASAHRDRLVLKGAMLFALWAGALHRSTRDLDFTGFAPNTADAIRAIVGDVCSVPCVDDGVTFAMDMIEVEPIQDDGEYLGLRVKVRAILAKARVTLQMDIGFGDAIEPPPVDTAYPTLLSLPAPHVRAYRRETAIAEKLHAMARHGESNSRFKDFYDVYILATTFAFTSDQLTRAIASTFSQRGWPDTNPTALGSRFYADADRADRWQHYLRRAQLSGAPMDFDRVGETIVRFLRLPWEAARNAGVLSSLWQAGGPWEAAS